MYGMDIDIFGLEIEEKIDALLSVAGAGDMAGVVSGLRGLRRAIRDGLGNISADVEEMHDLMESLEAELEECREGLEECKERMEAMPTDSEVSWDPLDLF